MVRIPPVTYNSTLDRSAFAARLISMAKSTGIAGFRGARRQPAARGQHHGRRRSLPTRPRARSRRVQAARGCQGWRADAGDHKDLSEHLDSPTQAVSADAADGHFGFLARMMPLDNPTASTITRELVNWTPAHPGIISDLRDARYYAADEN